MDIASITNRTITPPARRSAAKASKSGFATRPKSAYGVSGTNGATPIISPLLQLRLDYDNWKKQQEPQVLPESQGRTEENMNYLARRYSGSLTMFQKIEALDTMFDMGILTVEQRNTFYGDLTLKNFSAGQATIRSKAFAEAADDAFSRAMAQQEIDLYRLSPLAKSETLKDLFAWTEELV